MALDAVWIWYLATASAAVALFGHDAPQGEIGAYLTVHAGLLAAYVAMVCAVRGRGETAGRVARGAFSLLAILAVFSALGWVLPAVNPEPWEWTWIALDRALCGDDPTVALQAWLTPWLTEVLQLVYGAFYLIPVAAVLGCAAYRGGAGFDRALVVVVFSFLLSYLGYFLWPTLPPYRFLPHGAPLEGVWLAGPVREALIHAELHRCDCFPSGHTMVSLVSLALVWRHRALFWTLLPLAALTVLSTVALRYHYLVDVLAGAAFAVPGYAIGAWLARAR